MINNLENLYKSIQERQEKEKPKLEKVLGNQAINLLLSAGITDLRVDDEGLVWGNYLDQGYPISRIIKGITLRIQDKQIIIDGETVSSRVDVGKII